jgi:Asp-tRNA(Asn)/Glu-tRNA(Gln) amidotransferase A subunit family amidase
MGQVPRFSQDMTGDAARQRARVSRLNAFVAISDGVPPTRPGPLAGLAYAAKDLFDTPGRAPTLGLATPPRRPVDRTAAVLVALDAAGAARIGFAAMTPLAYEPSGANPAHGRPVNPWNPDVICGGSSSGSAVAVAAGIVPLAVGSDTAGSLRIPAQACGVTSWKPGAGVVPTEGAMPLAPSLDAIGFLAADAAILARVADLFAPVGADVVTVRFASDVLESCADPVVAAARCAATRLRAVGIRVVAQPGTLAVIDACDTIAFTLLQAEAAESFRDIVQAGTLDPILARRLAKGAMLAPAAVAQARAEMARLREDALARLFGAADAVMLPVMRIATPTVAVCEPDQPEFSARTLYALSALTRFVNVLGLPAVAVPAGFDERGCPVAVQVVGRPGADRAVVALACAFQALAKPALAGDPTTRETAP